MIKRRRRKRREIGRVGSTCGFPQRILLYCPYRTPGGGAEGGRGGEGDPLLSSGLTPPGKRRIKRITRGTRASCRSFRRCLVDVKRCEGLADVAAFLLCNRVAMVSFQYWFPVGKCIYRSSLVSPLPAQVNRAQVHKSKRIYEKGKRYEKTENYGRITVFRLTFRTVQSERTSFRQNVTSARYRNRGCPLRAARGVTYCLIRGEGVGRDLLAAQFSDESAREISIITPAQ